MEIHLDQIIFQIINFGVVFGALTFLMYKPVLKALKQRADKIEESQKAADEIISEKAQLDQTQQKTIADARKQANKIIEDAKSQAEAKKTELLKKAKADVADYLETEKGKWQVEKQQKLASIEKDVTDAVFAISGKVINKSLTKKDHEKLVDDSIKEIVAAL